MTLFSSQPFKSAPDRCHSARKTASLYSQSGKKKRISGAVALVCYDNNHSEAHQTQRGCYLVFYWVLSDIPTPAIASAQHWHHSASEYSQIFHFGTGPSSPETFLQLRVTLQAANSVYAFQWAWTEREDLSLGIFSLKEAFKVYLQNWNH